MFEFGGMRCQPLRRALVATRNQWKELVF
ncbi:acetyltransferase [Vibrio cholerae]|nr:acetyltransferase [Vibrio cholerae]